MFPFERLKAEVFVTSRVECWRMGFTERRNLEGRCEQAETE